MAQKLLITGFEPFGKETINPSWEAVRLLPDRVGNVAVTRLLVPTVFGLATETVLAKAMELQPDAILCVGQAGGRSAVTPEVIGINLREASIPDNAGRQPLGDPVVKGGPAAYFATLPVREMVQAIRAENLPGALSYSAGAFVCNDLLYSLLHHSEGTPVRVGFAHVPFLPQQARQSVPSLPLEDIVRALTAAIGAL